MRVVLLACAAVLGLAASSVARAQSGTASPAPAPPLSVAAAKQLLAAGNVDDLFIAWQRVKKGTHPEGDAPVAQVLVEAAKLALAKADAPLAVEFAEKARKLDPASPAACLAASEALVKLEQRGAAEEALDAALKLAPADADLLFRRASFAMEEGDFTKARDLFRKVPSTHARADAAKAGLARATEELEKRDRLLDETVQFENDLKQKAELASKTVRSMPSASPTPPSKGLRDGTADGDGSPRPDSGLGAGNNEIAGKTSRESDHFRVLYSAADRDFAARAEFESKALAMFERAHVVVTRHVGAGPARKVDVVLYTSEEFRKSFGGGGLLGFYSGKIRMNRSDSLDDRYLATAVHEYVHAVVDDLSGGNVENVPIWMNEGLAAWVEGQHVGSGFASAAARHQAREIQAGGGLPSLKTLARTPFGRLGGAVTASYAKSAAAIEYLVRDHPGGMAKLVGVLQGLGAGGRFDDLLTAAFGDRVLERLDAEATRLVTTLK